MSVTGVLTEGYDIFSFLQQKFPAIKKQWEKIMFYLSKNNIIAVFGAGGVGKSTIGRLLSTGNIYDLSTEYSESLITEPHLLKGEWGIVVTAPGQERRVEKHWDDIFKKIEKTKKIGIINVVAHGYHSFELNSYRDSDIYKNGMTLGNFVKKYSEHRRCVEIELQEKLLSGLKSIESSFWMLTIINKQDLWWNSNEKVMNYYTNGKYSDNIEEFQKKVGINNFQHEFLPVSLTLQNLTSKSKENIALTCAGYDQLQHFSHLSALYEKINGFISMEGK